MVLILFQSFLIIRNVYLKNMIYQQITKNVARWSRRGSSYISNSRNRTELHKGLFDSPEKMISIGRKKFFKKNTGRLGWPTQIFDFFICHIKVLFFGCEPIVVISLIRMLPFSSLCDQYSPRYDFFSKFRRLGWKLKLFIFLVNF